MGKMKELDADLAVIREAAGKWLTELHEHVIPAADSSDASGYINEADRLDVALANVAGALS